MDSLQPWSAHMVDLRTLFSEWERRRISGQRWTKRFREIHSVCMFTLCIENESEQRYLIGFQQRGIVTEPVPLSKLFDDGFGEVDDWDVLLVDEPKGSGPALHHRCQLVSYVNRPAVNEEDLVRFLSKKLRVAPDRDLRLVIHIEQEGPFNLEFLSAYLNHPPTKCPYSQVFAFGCNAVSPRKWLCARVYPGLAICPELSEEKAKALVVDREPPANSSVMLRG